MTSRTRNRPTGRRFQKDVRSFVPLPAEPLDQLDRFDRLAEKLRSVDFDRSRLSVAGAAEVSALAARAGIELPRAGVAWPSSPGADRTGGGITDL